MQALARYLRFFAVFRACSGGNVAIITALMLLPVLGVGGLAIDYSISSLQHSRLTALADSTALLGARRAKAIIEEGVGRINNRIDGLEGHLVKHFSAESAQIKGVKKKIDVIRDGQDVRVVINWSVDIPSVFGKLFGKQSYQIAGRSSSTVSIKPYLQLFVLVDVSQSMGIGATENDQALMFQREGCMFACHLPTIGDSKLFAGKTTYQSARMANPPINTRVDVARDGVLDIVQMAKEEAGDSTDRIKLGVYAFSNKLTQIVPIDQPVSSQFDEITKLVQRNLTLGQTGGGSNLMAALSEIELKITNIGDGSSPQQPKIAIILLSDGVVNSTLMKTDSPGLRLSAEQPFHSLSPRSVGAIQAPRSDDVPTAPNASQITFAGKTQIDAGRIGAMDSRSCERLKDKGVMIMVVETPYVIPRRRDYRATSQGTEDLRFAWLESAGRLDRVSSEMRSCATSGEHFTIAGPGAGAIEAALRDMGALALRNQLRLAN